MRAIAVRTSFLSIKTFLDFCQQCEAGKKRLNVVALREKKI